MKIIIAIVAACLFGTTLNILYIQQIGSFFSSGDSSYYLIDAYYYWYLGSVVNTASSIGSHFESAFDIAPTINSTGVVALAGFINFSPEVIYLLPICFLFIYLLLFYKKTDSATLTYLMIIAILIGTAPLPFLVSKESLLYVGMFLIARFGLCVSFSAKFLGVTAGLIFVAIGRYEVLAFLLMSYVLTVCGQKTKVFLFVAVAIAIVFYFDTFYEFALISERVAISQDNEFCGGITNTACLTSGASLATVLITRFLLSILLPLKWIFALFESFTYIDQVSLFWARFSQGLFALVFLRWLYLLKKYKRQGRIKLIENYSKIGRLFFVTYSGFYILVIFQQPTRQIQFALAVSMIFFTFGTARKKIQHKFIIPSIAAESQNNLATQNRGPLNV